MREWLSCLLGKLSHCGFSGLDCPRGLQNLHNWRLLTKNRQTSLQSQAGRLILPHTHSCIPEATGELLPQGSPSMPQGWLQNGETPAQVEQFAQNICGYYIHVLSRPAPALGFILSSPSRCCRCVLPALLRPAHQAHLEPGAALLSGALSQGKAAQEEWLGGSRLAAESCLWEQDMIPSRGC